MSKIAGWYIGEQPRWKSPVMWVSLITALITFLGEMGLYEKVGITTEQTQHIISFIMFVLTSFGVVNSPSNKGTL